MEGLLVVLAVCVLLLVVFCMALAAYHRTPDCLPDRYEARAEKPNRPPVDDGGLVTESGIVDVGMRQTERANDLVKHVDILIGQSRDQAHAETASAASSHREFGGKLKFPSGGLLKFWSRHAGSNFGRRRAAAVDRRRRFSRHEVEGFRMHE